MRIPILAAAILLPLSTSDCQQGTAARASTADQRAAVDATNGLGIDLYHRLAAEPEGGNLFFSPWSLATALTMTAEGARDETAAEMARVLHFPPAGGGDVRPIALVHAAFAALVQELEDAAGDASPATRQRIDALRRQLAAVNARATKLRQGREWGEAKEVARRSAELAAELNRLLPQVDRFELRCANGLWLQNGFPLLASYVAEVDRWYRTSGVENLDFAGNPEAARARINGWVDEHTEHRIENLIPEGGLSADIRMVLTNAVYFRGEWVLPFRESQTREEDFLLADGSRTRARLMHDPRRHGVPYAAFGGDGSYFATPAEVPAESGQWAATYPGDDGFTMVELPYKGDALSMLVIAPRRADGLPRVEALLSPAALTRWVGRLRAFTVDTAMLRFQEEQAMDLAEQLQALGMRRAFVNPMAGNGAQFGGMTAGDDPRQQLYVGAVRHKAWIEVNEKGTEAAAATAVLMAPGAAMPTPPVLVPFVPVFRADRPFLYLIRDRRSGAILFLGRVLDPRG